MFIFIHSSLDFFTVSRLWHVGKYSRQEALLIMIFITVYIITFGERIAASFPTISRTVNLGETVNLECSLFGDHSPVSDIVWTKNEVPIINFDYAEGRWKLGRANQLGKYETSTNSTILVLKSVQLADQGMFCCKSEYRPSNEVCHDIRVINQEFSATSCVSTTLSERRINPMIRLHDDHHVTEHEGTQIECFYEEKKFIHWELDGIDVTSNATIKYENNGTTSWLLLIPQRHFNGKLLVCSDDTDRQRMDKRILNVFYEPKILDFILPDEVYSNKLFTMTCVVDANPIESAMITVQRQVTQDSTISSWTTLINNFYSAASNTDEKQTWITTVNSVNAVPNGKYRCSVVNGIGKEVYSESKRLRVLDIRYEWETYIPEIDPKEKVSFQENFVTEVLCFVRYTSIPSVLRWSINNEDINYNASLTQHSNSSTSYSRSRLRFYPLRLHNGLTLKCTANNNSSLSDFINLDVQYCSDQLPLLACEASTENPYKWMVSCRSGLSNPPYFVNIKIDGVNVTSNIHAAVFENSTIDYGGFITNASHEKLYVKDEHTVTENIDCCTQHIYCRTRCSSCLAKVHAAQPLFSREDYYLIAFGITLLLLCGVLFLTFLTLFRKRRSRHFYGNVRKDPTQRPNSSNVLPMDVFSRQSSSSNGEIGSVVSSFGAGLPNSFRKHSYVTCVDSSSVISAPVSRDAYMNIDDQSSEQQSMEDNASVISKKLLHLKNRKLSIDSWSTGKVEYTRRIRSHPRSTTPRNFKTLENKPARGARSHANGSGHLTLSRENIHASHRSIVSSLMGTSKRQIVGEIAMEHTQFGDPLVKCGDICWFKASVYTNGENIPVVVKSVSENATLRVANHVTEELNELQKIGPHPNVLSLCGWNTTSFPNLSIFRLPPNCATLNSFLKYDYDTMQVREMETYNETTCKTAVTCSLDICRGMAFLSSNGFIHPCLSSHQVLVDFSHVCKLFAFTKADSTSTVSLVNLSPEEENLYEKWLPPEYLKLKEYCPSSDVWSFGVLLWEIFSNGEQPYYRNSVIDGSFLTGVNDLRKPEMCSTEIYHLMISCWNELPVDRPSFNRLQESLEHAYRSFAENCVY